MSHLAIFALGPLRIELDSQALQTSRHKAQALMVYLAMNPGKHSRSLLSALLWPDYSQSKAFSYLRRTLWEIKALLGEGWIEADREEIGFNSNASIYLDVVEFHAHLAAIGQHQHLISDTCHDCIARLHSTASLYRGDFLAGFNLRDSDRFEDWQVFQAEVLRREYAGALQKLVAMLIRENALNEAVIFSQRWLALDPLNEEAQRQLMEIFILNGERTQALRQFQECERLLKTELGVAPEPATAVLYETILSGEFLKTGDHQAEWIKRNSQAFPVNAGNAALSFQAESTPFIGRRQELEQISVLLANPDCWLLSLLGPGGIGKTRLAIEVGTQQKSNFSHGVFFIPLNTVEAPTSIAPAIASIVGLILHQNGRPPEDQLLDFLREKNILLILDSFERLVQSSALLGNIHSRAKGVKIIITSRHRLPMQSAWVVEVRGLDYPHESPATMEEFLNYTAVEFFLKAAHRTKVEFQMEKVDIPAITRLTHMLEGMPLGLELAAAWIKTLSCKEIADEINRSLDFLANSLEDLPEHQQSIRAVFDHSWRLMTNREKRLLPRLSVFEGIFERHAAEQVTGISLRELAGLVDKSLVQRKSDGFFMLHDLLRQYAREILNKSLIDRRETMDRHCEYYCTRLAEWNEKLIGHHTGQTLKEMEAHLSNIQAAWDWAVNHQRFDLLALALDGICMFYFRQTRFTEGFTSCQKVYTVFCETNIGESAPFSQQNLFARVFTWQAILKINLEKFEEADQLLQRAQTLLDLPGAKQEQPGRERAFLLTIQFLLANLQRDPVAAVGLFQQSIDISLQVTGKIPRFFVFCWRFLMSGNVSAALYDKLEKSLDIIRQAGDPFELACHLFTLGIGEAFHTFRLEKAKPMLRESCEIFRAIDDPISQVMIFKIMGYFHIVNGEFPEILALKQQELAYYQEIGDRRMLGITHAEIGEALTHLGKYSEAESVIRAALALVQGQSEFEYAHRHRYLGDVLLAEGRPEEARKAYEFSFLFFQSVNQKGWMITALTGLSRAELALGNRSKAWIHTQQALQLYAGIKIYTFFIYLTLAETALLLAEEGKIQWAAELFFRVSQQAYLAKSHWFADLYGKRISQAAQSLPVTEQNAIRERVLKQDFSTVIDTLLETLPTSV